MPEQANKETVTEAEPAVSVVIPGCKTPEQAEENFKSSDLALEVSSQT